MGQRTALIVGAGIGGLAAGVALRRAGWRVRIFERAADPRALGFALSLAPNAINALSEIGLAERLLAEGNALLSVELRRGDGSVLRRFNVASALGQQTSIFALRPALYGALLEATARDTLALDSEALGFEPAGSRVVLTLKDGRAESGDVLIGADGVRSAIRRQLHPDEPPLRRTGFFVVRGVAFGAAQSLGGLSVVGYLARGLEAATARASKDAVYWYVSLLADDAATLPREPDAILEWCGTLLDRGFQTIVRATRPADLRLDELFDRNPSKDWGSGRVTLLGDAAHPMLPHTGQGAAQALEDAVALSLVLASGDDVVSSLRRYERVRARRTGALIRRGRRIAKWATTKSPMIRAAREVGLRLSPSKALAASFLLARRTDPHRALR